jgi:hypothetical protein
MNINIYTHTQREEILESRRRRRVQLEAMMHDAEERLTLHTSGKKMLADDEVSALEKKADIFKRKLDTMKDDLDDREIERIMAREKLRNERLTERRAKEEEL